jgi:protein-arginine kinase activator protein McsA
MVPELNVATQDDFLELVEQKDFRIAQAIIESILNNLDTKKKNIHVLTVNCEEENAVFDITVDTKFFALTLEENLPYYVKEERYEECQKIVNAINQLKSKNN